MKPIYLEVKIMLVERRPPELGSPDPDRIQAVAICKGHQFVMEPLAYDEAQGGRDTIIKAMFAATAETLLKRIDEFNELPDPQTPPPLIFHRIGDSPAWTPVVQNLRPSPDRPP